MEWIVAGLVFLMVAVAKKAPTVIANVESSLNRDDFRKQFLAEAKKVDWQGIPVSIALAQADLESGAGTGSVFKKTNNLFSIKIGSGWKGHWNGTSYHDFRGYDSWADSMKDWVQLMHFQIYQNALSYALMGNVREFANEVKRVGYDTSEPRYAQLLVDRFNANAAAV